MKKVANWLFENLYVLLFNCKIGLSWIYSFRFVLFLFIIMFLINRKIKKKIDLIG